MRFLPLDYAVRNLGRRPMRTVLTALSAALVGALLLATTAFVRGMRSTFSGAAQADTAILLSSVAERDVVRSTVVSGLESLVPASVAGVKKIHGVPACSAEIHMGTNVRLGAASDPQASNVAYSAFIRGVTDRAFLVHERVTLLEGAPPSAGEVIVGRLASQQLGAAESALAVGRTLRIEGAEFKIAGRFAAPGTTLEAEIWAPLHELRGLTKRDDSSAVFVRLEDEAAFSELELFAKRRLDLELVVLRSSVYYRELSDYFEPIRMLAWTVAAIIGIAAAFGGANTLHSAVTDRMRELCTLRGIGYSGAAVVFSLAQESLLITAGGGVLGLGIAKVALAGGAVRLAMSAFTLQLDAASVLSAFGGLLLLGILGTAPAAVRALRVPVAVGLKET